MMNYTDSHCHLMPNSPCPDVLAGRICNATQQSQWEKFQIAPDDKTFGCIGIHPWYINTRTANWADELYDTLVQNPCLMVGEIGMDKYYPDIETQGQIFATQLQIASKLHRPAHIHCVGAWDKILRIFKELRNSMPPLIVLHSFSGDVDIIPKITQQYNAYLSYGVPQNPKDESRICATPRDRILLESDAFDNDTAIQKLKDAITAIAALFTQDTSECTDQIYQNFQRVTSYVRPID